jgi:hypothetical protein
MSRGLRGRHPTPAGLPNPHSAIHNHVTLDLDPFGRTQPTTDC